MGTVLFVGEPSTKPRDRDADRARDGEGYPECERAFAWCVCVMAVARSHGSGFNVCDQTGTGLDLCHNNWAFRRDDVKDAPVFMHTSQ